MSLPPTTTTTLCACGCGIYTSGKWNCHTHEYARYVHGHNATGKENSGVAEYLKGRKDPKHAKQMLGENNPNYKHGKRCINR